MDDGSLGAITDGFTMLLDVFFNEALFVDFVNEALAITKEEWCHGEGLEG